MDEREPAWDVGRGRCCGRGGVRLGVDVWCLEACGRKWSFSSHWEDIVLLHEQLVGNV